MKYLEAFLAKQRQIDAMSTTTTPDTIARIDFTELGCHWLRPGRRDHHPGAKRQLDECQRLLAEFVERHNLRPFKIRHRNLHALFKQGGAKSQQVREVVRRFNEGRPFDHGELWGRNGTPLMLIGHPYQITDDARATLAAIRGLGLVVSDYHPSWYGFSTCQVRAYHPGTLRQS